MNEAELLFTRILDCDRLDLYLNKGLTLDKEKSSLISCILKKRTLGEPLEYILNRAEFMGLEFKVNPSVLIPRPETEILVETAIKIVHKFLSSQVRKLKVLDIGTGSGCIAISLAKLLEGVRIDAVDISNSALQVARENAKLNSVSGRIRFTESDLFAACSLQPAAYSLIVSNPPYVSSGQIDKLQPEIQHEPLLALDGGKDGLDFYRKIIKQAPHYLNDAGFLIMEMGFDQAGAVKNIFQDCGNFEIIEVGKDFSGIDRVIIARKNRVYS